MRRPPRPSSSGPLAEARERVVAALPKAVRRPLTAARDHVAPAALRRSRTTPSPTRWSSASATGRAGCSSATPSGSTGVVTREDLDKAVGHELAHAPVKSVMTSSVETCEEDTPLAELQRLVAPVGRGPRAVVRDGTVVGVVTRSDLLRALDEPVAEPDGRGAPTSRSACSRSSRARAGLRGGAGRRREPFDGVYLVGGAVRDVLDGRAELRPRHRRRGGRDRVRPRAREGARRARGSAREVRHCDRPRRGRDARRRRHDPHRVLRLPGGASARRAGDAPPGSLPPRLHGERDGRLAQGRGLRRPRRLLRRPARPRGRRRARAPQALVHRRSDPHLPRHPLREPLRLPDGRATPPPSRGRAWRCTWSASSRRRGCGTSSSSLLGEEHGRRRDPAASRSSGVAQAIHPHLAADEEAVDLVGRSRTRCGRATSPEIPALARAPGRARASPAAGRALRLVRAAADPPPRRGAGSPTPSRSRRASSGSSPRPDEPAELRRLVQPHDPDGALLALALADEPVRGRARPLLRGAARASGSRSTAATSPSLGVDRVAAGGGDPRRAAAPEAERRAGRPGGRDRRRARAPRSLRDAATSRPSSTWRRSSSPASCCTSSRTRRRHASRRPDAARARPPDAEPDLAPRPLRDGDVRDHLLLDSSFIFGWAQPVLVDPRDLRQPQEHMALIAVAGPATNFAPRDRPRGGLLPRGHRPVQRDRRG